MTGLIIGGFAVLLVMLAASMLGAAWCEYKADKAELSYCRMRDITRWYKAKRGCEVAEVVILVALGLLATAAWVIR